MLMRRLAILFKPRPTHVVSLSTAPHYRGLCCSYKIFIRVNLVLILIYSEKLNFLNFFQVTAKPFQGSGNVLGSIAPAVVANDSSSSAQASGPALSEADAQKQVKVDTSKTMTTLQVRLMSGGRLIVKLNDTNTISDLRQYIRLLKPDTPPNFSLHTTFPNKEHTDDSATLKDAGLLGAAILMRPKK